MISALLASLSTVALAQDGGGPVRLVRFSWLQGAVEWRPDANSGWSDAAPNLPIREGSQVWVQGGGMAELMFDDGTVARLWPGSSITLQKLSSDSNGEFSELNLANGRVYLHAPHAYSTYQVDTQNASIEENGPARFRINAGNETQLEQFQGQASVQNDAGSFTVNSGQYGDIPASNAQLELSSLPGTDDWDRFNTQRDAICFTPTPHVPPNISLVCGGLSSYGRWVSDSGNGWVWVPQQDPNWTPYSHGHWVFVNPYGWTWVGAESWGWAPYHYGTWVHSGYGWAWAPGPATQYWSPAVVSFTYSGGAVCWAPLCPQEVHYPPALSVGFRSGNWSLYFSIGGAAVYAPAAGGGYCVPHPWSNVYVNRPVTITNVTNIYNNTTIVNNHFVPRNARFGGAVTTSLAGFQGRGGSFKPMAAGGGVQAFQHGSTLAVRGGGAPVFGPPSARPTAQSFTVNRTFTRAATPPPVDHTPASQGGRRGSFGGQQRPPVNQGQRGSFGGQRQPVNQGGQPPKQGAQRGSFGGQRPPVNQAGQPPKQGGQRGSFSGQRPPVNPGQRGSFGSQRPPVNQGGQPPRQGGQRGSFGSQRPPVNQGGQPPRQGGQRGSFGGQRPPMNQNSQRPAAQPQKRNNQPRPNNKNNNHKDRNGN